MFIYYIQLVSFNVTVGHTNSKACEECGTKACHINVFWTVQCTAGKIRDELHQKSVVRHSAINSNTEHKFQVMIVCCRVICANKFHEIVYRI